MTVCSSNAFKVKCTVEKPSISHRFNELKTTLSSSLKPILRDLHQLSRKIDVPKTIKNTSVELLDAFVNSAFEFIDQPLLPSQSNFAPTEERAKAILVNSIEGSIPDDFPEGVYIRNGPNPLFGGLKSTNSMFGRSSQIWVEGEGMLHALYFNKDRNGSGWIINYKNKHVQTDTFVLEKRNEKPCFLPAIEGDSPAVLSAFLLNLLRFGKINKCISNTNIFEHSGKLYSIAETDLPQEIDFLTLENLGNWDVNGAWNGPFTSHPKKAPGTGELLTMGIDAKRPFFVLGVISADGSKLIHKVDLKFNRCSLSHDIGVTQRSNVILDFPLILDINRLISGGPLIKYEKKEYAKIGVMPRYGNAESIKWFDVESCSAFHIINCFEDGDEVIVCGCRARESIIPGPDHGLNKFEWFSKGFKYKNSVEENCNDKSIQEEEGLLFSSAYEWRLNMKNGEVKEKNLTGKKCSMDFPMINEKFSGVKNKYAYTQVVDSIASSTSGMAKYGGLAKLYFEEIEEWCCLDGEKKSEKTIKIEYHMFPQNTFCTGSAFVSKSGALEEDDGWIISYVHDEDSNVSQVYIIDTNKFSSEAVAKITLPCRVPYGFHGAFIPK